MFSKRGKTQKVLSVKGVIAPAAPLPQLPQSPKIRKQTHRIQLPQVPPLGEMRAQARFRAASRNPAQRSQDARKTQQQHPRRPRQRRRTAIQEHGGAIEDVRREPVHFALGLERLAELVREEDGADAAGAFLQDGEEESRGWGGGGVAHADA